MRPNNFLVCSIACLPLLAACSSVVVSPGSQGTGGATVAGSTSTSSSSSTSSSQTTTSSSSSGVGGGGAGGGAIDYSPTEACQSGAPSCAWSRAFSSAYAQSVKTAVDADGNTYLAASYYGKADFGTGPQGHDKAYGVSITKLDAVGHTLWSRAYYDLVGDGDANVSDIGVDPSGAVRVLGTFTGTIDFGTGPVSPLQQAMFVMALDTNGGALWNHTYEGYSFGVGLSVTPTGDLNIAGCLDASLDFGGPSLSPTVNNVCDLFVAGYTAQGAVKYARAYTTGNGYPIDPGAVSAGPNGEMAITGTLGDIVDFGAGPVGMKYGVFLLALDSAGQLAFARGSAGNTYPAQAATFLANGDVAITGTFSDYVDFGSGPLDASQPETSALYYFRFDAHGAQLAARSQLFGNFYAGLGALHATPYQGDQLALSGSFSSTLDFGCGPLKALSVPPPEGNATDVFTILLDGSGIATRNTRFGGDRNQTLLGAAHQPGANAEVLAGNFDDFIDLGQGPLKGGGIFVGKLSL